MGDTRSLVEVDLEMLGAEFQSQWEKSKRPCRQEAFQNENHLGVMRRQSGPGLVADFGQDALGDLQVGLSGHWRMASR